MTFRGCGGDEKPANETKEELLASRRRTRREPCSGAEGGECIQKGKDPLWQKASEVKTAASRASVQQRGTLPVCISAHFSSHSPGVGSLAHVEFLLVPSGFAGPSICSIDVCLINKKWIRVSPGGPGAKNPPANSGDADLIPGPRRFHVPQGN